VWPLVTSIITRDLKECFSEVDTIDTIKNNAIISEARSFRHCKIMLSLVNHIFTSSRNDVTLKHSLLISSD
jgi:hypothetical protein